MMVGPRTLWGVALALLLASAGACASLRTIRYSVPRRTPAPSEFVAIREAWTRDAAVVPVSGLELAEFARAFPALRYEVRGPTLDDLFLKLSLTP